MKELQQVLIVTIIISVIGLTGCTNKSKSVAPSMTTSTAENVPIPVILPSMADIELSKGGSKSGQITAITDKQLTIELSGRADSIALKNIKQVKFREQAPLSRGSDPVIRSLPEIWLVTPLTAFQIKDSSKGHVEVLQKSVKKEVHSPTDPLGEPSSYVVKEMWFDSNSPGTMRLKVTGAN